MAAATEEIPIRLFGIPRYDTGTAAFFPSKAFTLIAALLLAPGQTLPRQVAASLLWGNVDQKRALGNLRQLLLRLQQFGGANEPLVLLSHNELQAGALAQRSDLAVFLRSLQAEDADARLQGILGVQGELLQDAETSEEGFYLWLLAERSRLKESFFTAVSRLLDDVTRFGGRKSGVIGLIADCALRLEPDREETYRNIMMAYSRLGDVDASQRVFDRLELLVKSEERSVESATLALRRRIRSYIADNDTDSRPVERAVQSRPRVAFLPPVTVDGSQAEPVSRAFIADVANSLVRFRTFKVLAPDSSFAATGERYAALRADYRVQSTVLDGMRLSVALIEETGAEIVWSLEVVLNERQIHSAFRLLSKQVAAVLAEQIERRQLEIGRKFDATAYLHLLSGQQLIQGKCDLPLLRRARSEFRKAVDLDPGMAIARARIGQTLQLEWLMLGGGDPHLLHRAKAEAEASVEVDPALGIGHWMCAVVALYQRDFDLSAERFLEAEALAPNSADLLLQHADALAHFGQPEPAWERFQTAIDLNPLAPDIYWWAGASIAFKREDYTAAVELCRRMEHDEPALRVLTASHAMGGDLVSARECGRRLQENYPGMTARQISGLAPDRDPVANEKLYQAFRLAGLK